MALLDVTKCRELKYAIKKITHTGSEYLNKNLLSVILNLCSQDIYATVASKEIAVYIKENQSEVRLSTAQLADALMKNTSFRKIFSNNIVEFLTYSIGLKGISLPPPKKAANEMVQFVITSVEKWSKMFNEKIFKTTYDQLRSTHNVDFELKQIFDPIERQERLEQERAKLKINQELLKNMNNEVEELKLDINTALTSLESLFSMLLPKPEEFCDEIKDTESLDMRLNGVVGSSRTLNIELNIDKTISINEDSDNRDILQSARDNYVLISNKFLPKVKAWQELLIKAKGSESSVKLAKELINKLENALFKYSKLKIIPMIDEEEVSSDSDLEEVCVKIRTEDEIKFFSKTLGLVDEREGISSIKTVQNSGLQNSCRAPLLSGKLCPRQDKVKCPFHGIIVERDKNGKILNKEDERAQIVRKRAQTVPDWQDPKLLAKLKATTGLDLKMPDKGKRLKKNGLTSIKKETAKDRLSKKIFKR